jgi:hypothetical protein
MTARIDRNEIARWLKQLFRGGFILVAKPEDDDELVTFLTDLAPESAAVILEDAVKRVRDQTAAREAAPTKELN